MRSICSRTRSRRHRKIPHPLDKFHPPITIAVVSLPPRVPAGATWARTPSPVKKSTSHESRVHHPSFLLAAVTVLGQMPTIRAAAPLKVETRNLVLSVDAENCRWSAEVKGTPMRLNDVYFLPGDDPSGWTVTGSVNNDDTNKLRIVRHRDAARERSPDNSISSTRSPPARPATTFSSAWAARTTPARHVRRGGHGLLRLERCAAGRHHRKMDQPGNHVPKSRVLRPCPGDQFRHAQDVPGESRDQGHGHRQQPVDGTRDGYQGGVAGSRWRRAGRERPPTA